MNVLIYGASLLGRQVLHQVQTHFKEGFEVLGFIDDVRPPGESVTHDLKTLGSLESLSDDKRFGPDQVSIIPAIGYSNMVGRNQALAAARNTGYTFPNLVHPAAYAEVNVTLGQGIVLLPGVVIDQNVSIADFNYFDIGSKVGEDTAIGENNYFSAGTTLGGSISVGSNNFFGLNTTVVNDITIGDNNFINAASLIHRPLENNQQVIELREQRTMTRR